MILEKLPREHVSPSHSLYTASNVKLYRVGDESDKNTANQFIARNNAIITQLIIKFWEILLETRYAIL